MTSIRIIEIGNIPVRVDRDALDETQKHRLDALLRRYHDTVIFYEQLGTSDETEEAKTSLQESVFWAFKHITKSARPVEQPMA